MSALRELQLKFQAYLLREEKAIFAEAVGSAKIPLEVRLDIYGKAYRLRLQEALSANYPAVQALCGCENFKKLALLYLEAHPSTFRSIRWFGNDLAPFLKKHPDYQAFPYLAELAELEWAMTESFDAADQEVVDLTAVLNLAPESWPELRLSPHPSIRFLSFFWNVAPIWQALTQEKPAPEPQRNAKPTAWLLWRKHLTNQFCPLPEDEAAALLMLLRVKPSASFAKVYATGLKKRRPR